MNLKEKKLFIRESGISVFCFEDYYIRKYHLYNIPYLMAVDNWLEKATDEDLKECVEKFKERIKQTEGIVLQNIYDYVNELILTERFDEFIKDVSMNSDADNLDYSMVLNYLENDECDLTIEDLEL